MENPNNVNIRIVITRKIFNDRAIIGDLQILDKEDNCLFECKTLENPKIGAEANKDLAIPYGLYKCFLHPTSRFTPTLHKMLDDSYSMLGVYNEEVPKDRYILIHWGNTEKDSLGCILLGEDIMQDNGGITQSRKMCRSFYQIVGKFNAENDINVIITQE